MSISELNNYLLSPVAQVALIIGIAELCKKMGLEKSLIPLVDLSVGLASGICVYGLMMGMGVPNGILIGLAEGLSACGLFSGIKNLTEVKE